MRLVTLGRLYNDLQEKNIALYPYDIGKQGAVTMEMQGKYAIFVDSLGFATVADMQGALVHEMGHCATGATHNMYNRYGLVEKHEYKANRLAIETYMPFAEVQAAMQAGAETPWQLAEWFALPQNLVELALAHYTETKGLRFKEKEETSTPRYAGAAER